MYPENLANEVAERIKAGELPSTVMGSLVARFPDLSHYDIAPVLVDAFDNSELIHYVWSWQRSKRSAAWDRQFDIWVISWLLREKIPVPWTSEYCQSEYERIQPALRQEAAEARERAVEAVSFESLEKIIRSFPGKVECIQALWDGDSDGWHLWMSAVMRNGAGLEERTVGIVKFGSDFRLFDGTVPPWPEAVHATEVGNRLAKLFDCVFYFPAPDEPDDAQKSWLEFKGRA